MSFQFESTIFDYEGLEFDIEYSFDPGEAATHDCPGSAPEAEINSIRLNNIEMIDMIRSDLIKYIEHKIALKKIQD